MKKGFKHSEITKEKMKQAKLKNPQRYWLGKKRLEQSKISTETMIRLRKEGKLFNKIKICKICGKEFKKKNSGQLYCGVNCNKIAEKKAIQNQKKRSSIKRFKKWELEIKRCKKCNSVVEKKM